MEKRNMSFMSAWCLPLLGIGALLLSAMTTETAKAEAPCIDDVAGGICVPVTTPESSKTSSESDLTAWNATGECDVAGGICETKETQAIAATQYARTAAASSHAPTCDVVAGICYGNAGSMGQVAKANSGVSALE